MLRRLAAVITGAAVAGAIAASPAGAVSAPRQEVYAGRANAVALDLQVLSQKVTLGQTAAKLTSQLVASADGTAILSLLGSTTSSASVSGANASKSDGPRCNPTISLVVVLIKNACTVSTAAFANALGHASTRGTVDDVSVNLNSVLSSIPLGTTLKTVLQPIVNDLGAITGQKTTLDAVGNTVGGVLQDVLSTPTAHLVLGDATSDVVSTPSALTATAVARGGQLDILPAPAALNGAVQPLASVIIGSSKATATFDRLTGKVAKPTFDPALLTVKLAATPLTPATTIPVQVGTTTTITLPAGLGSIFIQVADGNTFTNPDGSVGAEANAVRLDVNLLGQPLLHLALAGAKAQVAGLAPSPAAPLVNTPVAAPALPRTGGTPWIPLAGGFVLVSFLVTRRVLHTAR